MGQPYTIDQIKKSLAAYDGKDTSLVKNIQLLLSMPEREATPVFQAVVALANSVNKLGALGAFYIVVKVGRYMACQEETTA